MIRKILAIGVFASALNACTVVNPGYVGVKVDNYGTQRGVQDIPVVTGRVFYNPVTTSIFEFPTFLQNRVWTKDPHEGNESSKADDESITFNSIEGASVNCDIGVSVSFDAMRVPHIFVEQRTDPNHIIDVYIRNKVRDAFSRHGWS